MIVAKQELTKEAEIVADAVIGHARRNRNIA